MIIKLKDILRESMDLQKYVPNVQQAHTVDDFLKSLVGYKLKDLLDAASFARLYIGNKYGFNDPDKSDHKYLLSRLLNAVTDFINFRKIQPLRRALDAKEAEEQNTPEYKKFRETRMKLLKAKFQAAKDGNKELSDKLGQELLKMNEPTSYSKNMKDMEQLIKQFHTSPLTLPDLLPNTNDTEEDKGRYERLKKAFDEFKGVNEDFPSPMNVTGSKTSTDDAILLIPDYDEETPQSYPGNIQPGYYNSDQVMKLVAIHSKDPNAIQFIADMLDMGNDDLTRSNIVSFLRKNKNNPQKLIQSTHQ